MCIACVLIGLDWASFATRHDRHHTGQDSARRRRELSLVEI